MLKIRPLIRRQFSRSSAMGTIIPLRRRTVERTQIPSPLEVHLTEEENQICDLLDNCTRHLKEQNQISTSCRIAGGWVRDKLLGHDSNDIDIALSDMMGLAFAEHLASYADMRGIEFGKIAKIAQNPDQSKHLETATLKLAGLDIDLVNLRSEEYAENSRIPTEVTFGTPLQDAKRRDITINALFYNVHSKEVEDYTGKGFDDLRDGLIRTPLPPRETFKDDPLRVLRCIRFASRFGFELVPDLVEAAKDPAIQDALVSKVARERVGTELSKMMQGRDPLHSIELFNQLSLYNSIFFSAIPQEISSTFSEHAFDIGQGLASSRILDSFLSQTHSQIPSPHPFLLKHFLTDKSARPRLFLSAALTPFKDATYSDKKKRIHPGVEAIVRDSLKLGAQNHYADGIPALFLSIGPVLKLLNEYQTFPVERTRSSIGLGLRNKAIHNLNAGLHWSQSVLFSLIVKLGDIYDITNDSFNVDKGTEIITRYNRFAERVEELELYDVGDDVPIIDGRGIMNALGVQNGGPWLSEVQLRIIQWQLDSPQASANDCLVWLKEEQTAGNLPLPSDSSGPPSKRARNK